MKGIFVMLLLLIPFAAGQQGQIYGSSGLDVLLNISSSARIVPKSSSYSIDYLTVNLTFIPKDDVQQEILDIIASPEPDFAEDSALFRWDNPKRRVSFFLASEVETSSNPLKVMRKVQFPLEDVGEYYEYTLPTENIDSDDEDIIRLASGLAAGEDDEFVVVSKLAQWSQENIEYNLSTLTADVSQKASWVLENRQGVCDELTNLFIAMNRALGIPARFVSGVSYTESPLFPENWGMHGWAEVYFPGTGWVPFDVTYGQFGYVDPSHIKLRSAADVADGHTVYSWRGSNVDVLPDALDADAKIISIGKPQSPPFGLSISVANDDVGFGSYNLVEVTVKNLKPYYAAEKVIHAKTEGLMVEDEERSIVLEPFGEKKLFFLIKVKEGQDRRFVYTYPLLAYTSLNLTVRSEFRSSSSSPVYPREYFARISGAEQQPLSSSIRLNCSADRAWYYIDEVSRISCVARNSGNVFIENLDVCVDSCRTVNLGITQSAVLNFSKRFQFAGPQKILVTASNSELSRNVALETAALDIPHISIAGLDYPETVKYNDDFSINFLLDRNSVSAPSGTLVVLSRGRLSESWRYDNFTDRNITFAMRGKDLDEGMNSFELDVSYQDGRGRKYGEKRQFSIILSNVTFFQRIAIFFRNIGK